MPMTLGGRGDGCFSETTLSPAAPPRPGQHHRLAARQEAEVAVVTRAVRARRLPNELGEAGAEGTEARAADREADIRHAQVARRSSAFARSMRRVMR